MRKICLMLASCLLALAVCIADDAVPSAKPYFGFRLVEGRQYSGAPALIVEQVVSGSPASKAGLRAGDIITAVDGRTPETNVELHGELTRTAPGQERTLLVRRAKQTRAVRITPTVFDERAQREAEKMAAQPRRDLKDVGINPLIYIPQALCYTGLTFSEALAVSAVPGAVTVPLSELERCRHHADACVPLGLVSQTGSSTLVTNGAVKYKLRGDWRRLSFESEDKCRAALGGTQQEANAGGH